MQDTDRSPALDLEAQRAIEPQIEESPAVIEPVPGALEEAVESLGAAVEAHAGDGGAREEEVSAAQQRFDELGADLQLGDEAGAIVREGVGFVVELFKHRPKPWPELSQLEQRDLIGGVEENVHELVRQIVEAVVNNQRVSPVRCLFVGFTDKGDDIKAELKLKALSKDETEDSVLFFHRARGQHVMVTLASAEEYHREPARDESQPDQSPLGFEAGSDTVEHPADDSDLVAAAEEEEAGADVLVVLPDEGVKAGTLVQTDEHGEVAVHVDLKTGMLTGLTDDDSYVDLRAATPAELAAERERVADFEPDEAATTEA